MQKIDSARIMKKLFAKQNGREEGGNEVGVKKRKRKKSFKTS